MFPILGLLAFLGSLPPAADEGPHPGTGAYLEAQAHGEAAKLSGVAPWAGVITFSQGRNGWSVLNFYVVGEPRSAVAPVRVFAKLSRGGFLQRGTEQYIDGDSCPMLRTVMLNAERIPVPRIHNDALAGDRLNVYLDAVNYRLWGSSRFPGATEPSTVEITGMQGSPIARYLTETLASLGSCWRSEPPHIRGS